MTAAMAAERLGVDFHDWQTAAFLHALHLGSMNIERQRMCLYYKTGSGKTITALVALWLMGYKEAVVITPPSTYSQWEEQATKLGMTIHCISHAKFRQKGTKLRRTIPVIADEFHLFGGHKGQGWRKFATLSRGLQAPIILASATPNYNDAERVYCIEHVLDPVGTKGGYLEFLYRNCRTEYNPFGQEPIVTGFQKYQEPEGAAEYLAALPDVLYLPDDLVYTINEENLSMYYTSSLDNFGYDERNDKMVASQIEERHLQVALNFMGLGNELRSSVRRWLTTSLSVVNCPTLIFCVHSTIAERVALWLGRDAALVTGKTSTKEKARIIADFNAGKIKVLVGTASLATGTDGMDKVCHHLIILDDTDDDALRRQLIGRIMPRGNSTVPASSKLVRRLNFS